MVGRWDFLLPWSLFRGPVNFRGCRSFRKFQRIRHTKWFPGEFHRESTWWPHPPSRYMSKGNFPSDVIVPKKKLKVTEIWSILPKFTGYFSQSVGQSQKKKVHLGISTIYFEDNVYTYITGKMVVPLRWYPTCIWGWWLRGPHRKSTTIFPMNICCILVWRTSNSSLDRFATNCNLEICYPYTMWWHQQIFRWFFLRSYSPKMPVSLVKHDPPSRSSGCTHVRVCLFQTNIPTPLQFNIDHRKFAIPKGKGSSSNHHFSRVFAVKLQRVYQICILHWNPPEGSVGRVGFVVFNGEFFPKSSKVLCSLCCDGLRLASAAFGSWHRRREAQNGTHALVFGGVDVG